MTPHFYLTDIKILGISKYGLVINPFLILEYPGISRYRQIFEYSPDI